MDRRTDTQRQQQGREERKEGVDQFLARCLPLPFVFDIGIVPSLGSWLNVAEGDQDVHAGSGGGDGGENMVEVPVYLNTERKTILCAVRLKGRSEQFGSVGVPWYELGTAVTLWCDP